MTRRQQRDLPWWVRPLCVWVVLAAAFLVYDVMRGETTATTWPAYVVGGAAAAAAFEVFARGRGADMMRRRADAESDEADGPQTG